MTRIARRTARRSVSAALIAASFASLSFGQSPTTVSAVPYDVAALHRLDLLPAFKDGVSVASFSSYDREGGNEDGFKGVHSFLRKEGDRLVIAEMNGPGVITRIWTPTPTDDLVEFWFDGESEPRLSVKFRDLFSGKQTPFLHPVSGLGAGGFYTYLPLPYAKSCKVTIKTKMLQFYQINYSTFTDGRGVKTFEKTPSDAFKADFEKAQQLIRKTGSDISESVVAPGTKLETHAFRQTLDAGKWAVLFESNKPGRIASLKISPASAFAGRERDVLLNVYYDGETEPSFTVPAGDFFGYSFGEPSMRSLMVGTAGEECYSYFPMPYEKSIRIELASDNPNVRNIAVRGEVKTSDAGRAANEGKFFAVWNRESPTTAGKPFTFINTQGKGHAVGFALQAQGPEAGGMPLFFEGDDQATIDGKLVIHGTGSEDFFNGGWYDVPGQWTDRVLLPFSGALDYKRYLGRTGGYRLLLTDAYAFSQSLTNTIEHGPENNQIPTDYTSVTYLYADRTPTAPPLPAHADRSVSNPKRAVFDAGVTMPIYGFSRDGGGLTKTEQKIGEHGVRFLSFKAHVRDLHGGSQFITLVADLPQAGKYRVSLVPVRGPEAPIVQLIENELPLGERVDLYSPNRERGEPIAMAEIAMKAGDNRLLFKIVDKNEKSNGYQLDIVQVICERID